jgi:tetratricopeptide (TPR) repeat protein
MSLVERDLILGKNFAKTKSYEETIKTFERALEKCKSNSEDYPETKIPELRYHLAKTKFEKKNIQTAISDFKEIRALKNLKETWIKPWSHFYLGRCLEESGEFQRALAEYEAAYKFDDNELRFQIDRRREELQNSF